MALKIEKKILSFGEMPRLAAPSGKTVLLVRHSFRQSLNDGTYDPPLTQEGAEYARSCGAFLAGMGETAFGASPRLRARQTAEELMRGGGFPEEEVRVCPELGDTAMFTRPENLDAALASGNIAGKLRSYYSTGRAPGMKDLDVFSSGLLEFLTGTDFGRKNAILATHDILLVALLSVYGVYPFRLDDWCGYVQGAALFQSPGGGWTMAYAVPDASRREKYALFV
ncbi:MAG: histidine phosphatase family protein [Lentisphaeria bacterium]|nr:histidine phosphatase family protein [Lentisphaeria bacterium]